MYPRLLSLVDFGEISYRTVNGLETGGNSYEDICRTTHFEDSQRVLLNPNVKAPSEQVISSQTIAPQPSSLIVVPSSSIEQCSACPGARGDLKGEKSLGTS